MRRAGGWERSSRYRPETLPNPKTLKSCYFLLKPTPVPLTSAVRRRSSAAELERERALRERLEALSHGTPLRKLNRRSNGDKVRTFWVEKDGPNKVGLRAPVSDVFSARSKTMSAEEEIVSAIAISESFSLRARSQHP